MEFQADGGHPLGGGGCHLFQAIDTAQALLQRVGNTALHVFCRGTAPDHPHADHIQGKGGEKLDIHPGQRQCATQQHHQHYQVAGNPVMNKETDYALLSLHWAGSPSASASSTFKPVTALGRWVVIRRAPGVSCSPAISNRRSPFSLRASPMRSTSTRCMRPSSVIR